MKTIIGPRGSGKTKELLKFASDNNYAVFSNDVEIYGFDNELANNKKPPIVIHDVNKFVQWCFSGYTVKGFSATMEDTDD